MAFFIENTLITTILWYILLILSNNLCILLSLFIPNIVSFFNDVTYIYKSIVIIYNDVR
jgi:hypothetical protein